MGGSFEVGDEQDQRQQHQQGARDVHGQVGQGNDGQDRRQPTDDAGQDEARVGKLGDDSVTGDDDQQGGDGGVDERVQEDLPERHRVVVQERAAGMEGEAAVGAGCFPAVDLVEQRVDVRHLEVGDVNLHCLLGVDVHAVAHGLLCPVGVAAVHLGQVAHPGDGVVQHLGPEISAEVFAGGLDRVRGADVGAWGHGQDVGRLGDEETGRCRAGAARVHEDDDRHLAVEEAGHDVVHGVRDAARSIQNDEQGVGMVGFGTADGGLDV